MATNFMAHGWLSHQSATEIRNHQCLSLSKPKADTRISRAHLLMREFGSDWSLRCRRCRCRLRIELWHTLRQEFSAPLSPEEAAKHEQAVKSIRENLGEAASSRAWSDGQAMSAEKAIQYTLAVD